MNFLKDYLQNNKRAMKKTTMITAYDFPTASCADECGIDIVLVGDSVGTNVLGYDDVFQVTMDDMIHHVRAVARGIRQAFILADMPYQSFQTCEAAYTNARRLIDNNANGVKIEGELEVASKVAFLVKNNISVCAHIGYTPQTKGKKPTVQGKDTLRAQELIKSALALEGAGACMIVLELITGQLAGEITRLLHIPTIGIGSGPLCDGQVLVMHDMIGMSARTFKHVKTFGNAREELKKSLQQYAEEVRDGTFPAESNTSSMPSPVFDEVKEWIAQGAWRVSSSGSPD
jgi:3-methyl-2-oxobutanoate hydroxymethyltransferase